MIHQGATLIADMPSDQFLPLSYQIAVIVLTALFFFAFSVAREPRGWRRLFQSVFASSDGFSVNKNKVIDETLKKYGMVVAMLFLLADVGIVVLRVKQRTDSKLGRMDPEQMQKMIEIQKIQSQNGGGGARSSIAQ